ncbi:MAG: DUF6057 family protein [Prevotella sp.]|nr:DUF6057 family protein [Prevotella sp.]
MHSSPAVRRWIYAVCGVVFYAFAFCYLSVFQADLLAYAVYSLSGGRAVYNSLIGAAVITLVLLAADVLLSPLLLRRLKRFPAIRLLVPAMLLAMICDVHIAGGGEPDLFGNAWMFCIPAVIVLFVVNFFIRGAKIAHCPPLQALFLNLLAVLVFLSVGVFAGNTCETDHVRLRCERCLLRGDYDGAVHTIARHNVNTPPTAMMKAFAMAQTGRLGECFFERNVVNGSASLFPADDNKLLMISPNVIYEALGGVPAPGVSGREWLALLRRRGRITPLGRDYLYTACLLDRDIDAFVKYYAADNDTALAAPKHYGEALDIYRYEHDLSSAGAGKKQEAGFADFLSRRRGEDNRVLRENGLRDAYGSTYWFYYFFTSSNAFTQSVSNEN